MDLEAHSSHAHATEMNRAPVKARCVLCVNNTPIKDVCAHTVLNKDLKIDVYGKPQTANFKSYVDFNSLVFEFKTIGTLFYIKTKA